MWMYKVASAAILIIVCAADTDPDQCKPDDADRLASPVWSLLAHRHKRVRLLADEGKGEGFVKSNALSSQTVKFFRATCKKFCGKNKRWDWDKKCKWKVCSGCDECTATTTLSTATTLTPTTTPPPPTTTPPPLTTTPPPPTTMAPPPMTTALLPTTTTPVTTATTTPGVVTKYPFVGCKFAGNPFRQQRGASGKAALTQAGIEGCLDNCKASGYLFGALTCPDSEAECWCYSGQIYKSAYWGAPHHLNFNGPASRCAKTTSRCSGATTVAGYATGGDDVLAVYGLEPLAPWATGSSDYQQVAVTPVQSAAGAESPASTTCSSPSGLPFSTLLAGADVVVPSGQTYVLDRSVEVEGTVTVEAGATLAFPDVAGLTLSTTGISVLGTLTLGTEECPLRAGGSGIVLRGPRPAGEVDAAYKGVSVGAGGMLDVHGRPYAPTWTRLQSTARAGQADLELQQPVDWEPGQELVVVTTVHIDDREAHQNEVRTIAAVRQGRWVTLDQPLQFSHYAGPEYAGEVGLLSRSVTIQGDEESETEQYGGHTMCGKGSTCRLSFVRGFRMGQTNFMGRYPFHFHLMGDVAQHSFFRGLAVHHSFWRAVSIHGTSSTTFSRCVAYDILGSAVYLEDGVEEDNLIEFNLVAHIHPIKPHAEPWKDYNSASSQSDNTWLQSTADRLLPTDLTPAAFYCLNPRNRWVGNVASGGFTGFIFPAVQQALGLSAGKHPDLVPQEHDLLEFDGNTAHSSGQHFKNGACIYVGGTLRMADPQPERDFKTYEYYYWKFGAKSYERGAMLFKNTKLFACRAGFKAWGFADGMRPQIKLQNTEFHDNELGIAFFGHNSLETAVFTAHTGNAGVFPSYVPSHAFQLYDTLFTSTFSDVAFRGYSGPADVALYQFVIGSCCVPSGLLSLYHATFPNTTWNRRFHFDPGWADDPKDLAPQTSNAQDVDGGLSGVAGGAILGAGDTPSCRDGSCETFQWWVLDDSGCQLLFTEVQSPQLQQSRGYWACPRVAPVTQQTRTVVSLLLAKGDKFCSKSSTYPFFQWSRGCLRWMKDADLVKGTVYQFGHEDRRARTGLSTDVGGKMLVGTCCDIGWYLDIDGDAPPVLGIFLDQMVPSGGLVFAIRYPASAQITAEKCFGGQKDPVCNALAVAGTKSEFLGSPTGSMILLEAGSSGTTVFLKLVNERNEYMNDSTGMHALLATNDFYQGRYIVRSDQSGPVEKLLPPADWITE